MPDNNLYTTTPATIVFYTTSWCPDCRRARAVLDRSKASYIAVDVDADGHAAAFVKQVNHGCRSVPTIVFPDGDILVEPSNRLLEEKLQGA